MKWGKGETGLLKVGKGQRKLKNTMEVGLKSATWIQKGVRV